LGRLHTLYLHKPLGKGRGRKRTEKKKVGRVPSTGTLWNREKKEGGEGKKEERSRKKGKKGKFYDLWRTPAARCHAGVGRGGEGGKKAQEAGRPLTLLNALERTEGGEEEREGLKEEGNRLIFGAVPCSWSEEEREGGRENRSRAQRPFVGLLQKERGKGKGGGVGRKRGGRNCSDCNFPLHGGKERGGGGRKNGP